MEHHESFFGNPRTWIGLAFFIFYAIFGRKLWAAITGLLDKRAASIRFRARRGRSPPGPRPRRC